ncbi:MAG: glycosyltransferase family 9 protein [Verrucomicrobiales bacterium]
MPKIAVISLKQLGDTLLLQPAIDYLSRSSGEPVALTAKPAFAPLLELMPGAREPEPGARYQSLWVFERGSKAARKAFFTSARDKHLVLIKNHFQRRYHRLVYSRIHLEHNRKHNLSCLYHRMACGGSEPFQPARLERPPERWAGSSQPPAPYILLNPTAAWESKAWSVKQWVRVIERLRAEGGGRAIVISGGGGEWERRHAAEIVRCAGGDNILELAGRTSLRELLYLVSRAALVVTIDGATAHFASALGRPTLVLFGPTKSEYWHWGSARSVSLRARDFTQVRFPPLEHLPDGVVSDAALELLRKFPPA